MENQPTLAAWDYVPIALYFILVLAVGLLSLCRSNRGTVSGYFLAGRYMTWLPSCLLIQLMAWVFLPVYIASGVYTLPEYMRKRFGGQRIRLFLATLSLILYIFTKISVNLYAGALFLKQALNWDLYVSVILLLAVTGVCMITGGLAAVIYTDTLQFFIMMIGSTILTVISLVKVGGYEGLKEKYMEAIPEETLYSNSTCGIPRSDSWQMLRDPVNSDIPWAGFIFGQTWSTLWYWCADQMIVQRTLSAKSLSHAQGGCLFAGYAKFLPVFLMVLPGMVSRVLYPNEVACASAETCMAACGNPSGCSNIAYPRLVMGIMPVGLRGLMMAAMVAALMSDLTSIFNSVSTLFTMDIWKFMRVKFSSKNPSVRELMIVGRLVVVVMIGVSILWIPIVEQMQGGQLLIYKVAFEAALAPPVAAVYLVAILWPRSNEKGCFFGMMAGFMVGVVRMILNLIYQAPPCWEEDTRPAFIGKLHFTYFALILFVLTVIVDVVVSLLTQPPQPYQLIRTTWWSRYNRDPREDDFEDDKEEIELQEVGEVVAEEEAPREWKSLARRGYDWFCGYDDSSLGQAKAREHRVHLREVTALKQDPRAKIFLNTNLVIILLITPTFLVIFSIPGLI
ncbi:sodium/glucose cotransporter 4-like isoform X2 [Patiria miniata]|uniref:Sodium/glucose cotransporter 4 n=1 Tax=Patiria miniata TaxID=46514 RepID=A0A913Z541_PATMI|nr:sodium/glucose cotransporter 4-like isoform X2 [Patiria miniata]